MEDKIPEQDGYQSIAIFKEASLRFLVDMMKWLEEEWFPDNGYDPKGAIMRITAQGYYEIMAKPT